MIRVEESRGSSVNLISMSCSLQKATCSGFMLFLWSEPSAQMSGRNSSKISITSETRETWSTVLKLFSRKARSLSLLIGLDDPFSFVTCSSLVKATQRTCPIALASFKCLKCPAWMTSKQPLTRTNLNERIRHILVVRIRERVGPHATVEASFQILYRIHDASLRLEAEYLLRKRTVYGV